MSCKFTFSFQQPVKTGIFSGKDSIPHLIILFNTPTFGDIRNQSLFKPGWNSKKYGSLQPVFNISAIQQLMEEHLGYSGSDLLAKVFVITIKINEHFIPQNPGQSTGISHHFIALKTYIGLLQIGISVKNHKLQAPICPVIKEFLNCLDFAIRGAPDKFGQILATDIKIGVEVLKTVESPVKIIVLNPVFAKIHLVTLIELC
ncbi:MAG: hypothetical protein BWY67_01544 [Bacteroidetes bacterium ADurb.Bin397]|nr:MAG: hypothetical protein BWY67_01544 [Bacteroidetes bacterium ADurb.Bin397]